MRIFIFLNLLALINFNFLFSQELECQGAILRILNKTTNEVLLQGLKTLTKLTPNGNNLLFQINWSKNKTIINRTHKEAYDLIVGTYKESVRKKVSVHAGYETL